MAGKIRTYGGMAALVLAQVGTIVSCSDGGSDDEGSGGGTPTGGSAPTGGHTGDGGGPPTGGSGGLGGAACEGLDPEAEHCAVCEATLDEFCEVASCSPPTEIECGSNNFTAVTYHRGCGYLRRSAWGEEESSKIWSEDTDELVYFRYSYPVANDACDVTIVGEAPSCDDWEDACPTGQGGAGGEGGFGGTQP